MFKVSTTALEERVKAVRTKAAAVIEQKNEQLSELFRTIAQLKEEAEQAKKGQ